MKIMWKKTEKHCRILLSAVDLANSLYIKIYMYILFIYSVLFINKANHSARQHGQSAVVPCRQL